MKHALRLIPALLVTSLVAFACSKGGAPQPAPIFASPGDHSVADATQVGGNEGQPWGPLNLQGTCLTANNVDYWDVNYGDNFIAPAPFTATLTWQDTATHTAGAGSVQMIMYASNFLVDGSSSTATPGAVLGTSLTLDGIIYYQVTCENTPTTTQYEIYVTAAGEDPGSDSGD